MYVGGTMYHTLCSIILKITSLKLCCATRMIVDNINEQNDREHKKNQKQKIRKQSMSTHQTNYLSFSEVLFYDLLRRLLTKLNLFG